jgi:hypothetical protein
MTIDSHAGCGGKEKTPSPIGNRIIQAVHHLLTELSRLTYVGE